MQSISRVLVVEDDENTRAEIAEALLDAELEPIQVSKNLGRLEQSVAEVVKMGDALVCDYRLAEGGYQTFTGAQLVAQLTDRSFPAVLFSRYPSRRFRQLLDRVPVILAAGDVASDPGSVVRGFRYCQEEHSGRFRSDRKPWRTIIRVEEVHSNGVTVSLPAWNHHQVVHLDREQLPHEVVKAVDCGQRFLHARVNLGESDPDRLYFTHWEAK